MWDITGVVIVITNDFEMVITRCVLTEIVVINYYISCPFTTLCMYVTVSITIYKNKLPKIYIYVAVRAYAFR